MPAIATTHPAAALGDADLVFSGMADVSGWLSAQGLAERAGAAGG